jgi:ketosteroid isomerase-like protein
MGLLFQPRRGLTGGTAKDARTAGGDRLSGRAGVFRAALEAVVLGDASRFLDLFTEDVAFSSPHLSLTSRAAVQAALGVPEVSLSDVGLEISPLEAIGDRLMAEWRLNATFREALLFDDNMLIEPTGGRVELLGASVAEFRDERICAFRHYFDDSELLDQLPGMSTHVRWTRGELGPQQSG